MGKKLLVVVLMLALSMAVFGCSQSDSDSEQASAPVADEKKVIKIGTTATVAPELEPGRAALLEKGYEMELVVFDDSMAPNAAVDEGVVDCNYYQNEPFLKNYNKQKGTDLIMLKKRIRSTNYGLYSEKYDSVESLPEKAVIGIANDASNQARGMNILQDVGLITLKSDVAVPTKFDIVDNPKNLQFVEITAMQMVSSLPDVDAITSSALYLLPAGKDPQAALALSKDVEKYSAGFTLKPENKDAEWVKALEEAFSTDEYRQYLLDNFKGAFVPMF